MDTVRFSVEEIAKKRKREQEKKSEDMSIRVRTSSNRSKEKKLIALNMPVNLSQTGTLLLTVAYPCSVSGFRWSLSILAVGPGNSNVYWMIVLAPAGDNATTLGILNEDDAYAAEQNVVAFGKGTVTPTGVNAGWAVNHFEGKSNSFRRVRTGDRLFIITKSNATTGGTLIGTVQFFQKV